MKTTEKHDARVVEQKRQIMKQLIIVATVTLGVLGTCIAADNTAVAKIGPVQTVTVEPGVVPSGTSIVVRTKEAVRTSSAHRSTAYLGSVAADVLDQNGGALIPRESPIELVVRSLPYLGPGGAGMTVLTLDIDAVTVGDVRYAVETNNEAPGAGGIGVNRGGVKWVGGSEDAVGHVVTRGRSINVPADTLLAFQTEAPIRLRGYQR